MDKDRAIITQVCAKIAADLTDKSIGVEERIGEFATLFSSINDIIMDTIYGDVVAAEKQNATVVAMVKDAFNGEDVSAPTTSGGLTVVGKQHGALPDWLIKACKRDGVTKIYDNRDGANATNKRPHFKAVDAEKAYWPPRSK
jgi:hypothetical protein